MDDTTAEFEAGWTAAINGKNPGENPYSKGTPEHDEWARGWEQGEIDRQF